MAPEHTDFANELHEIRDRLARIDERQQSVVHELARIQFILIAELARVRGVSPQEVLADVARTRAALRLD